MTRSQQNRVLLIAVIGIPTLVATGWWFYVPVRTRAGLQADVNKALAANQLDAAAKSLPQLLKVDPQNLDNHLRYIQVLRRLHRKDEAQIALEWAMHEGLSEKAGEREAALLAAEEHFDQVGGTLQLLYREKPDDAEVLEALARGEAGKKRYARADRLYTLLLENHPQRQDIYWWRGQVRRGRKRFVDAAADFRVALQSAPDDFAMHLYLADCLLSDARLEEAESELLLCLRLQPDNPAPLVPLATCALNRGDLANAQDYVTKARTMDPANVRALQEQGNLYIHQRRYDQAIPLFEEVVQRAPTNAVGHLKLAQALRHQGQVEKALEHERLYRELEAENEKAQSRGESIDD